MATDPWSWYVHFLFLGESWMLAPPRRLSEHHMVRMA